MITAADEIFLWTGRGGNPEEEEKGSSGCRKRRCGFKFRVMTLVRLVYIVELEKIFHLLLNLLVLFG